MKINFLNLLFALYVTVLVLMCVKFYYAKHLSNLDIILHLLLVAVLGCLIMYTGRVVNKREQFEESNGTVSATDAASASTPNGSTGSAGVTTCSTDTSMGKGAEFHTADGAPLEYKMGPYSNVKLDASAHQNRRVLIPGFNKKMQLGEKETDCGNLHTPCGNNYILKPFHVTPTGVERTEVLYNADAPTIDGNEGTPKRLFMFAHNRCHPGCCPGTYSCSSGCVCTTKDQRNFIGNRGMA